MELFLQCQSSINTFSFSDAGNVTFKCIFLGGDYLCLFWQKGSIIFVTFTHMYIKYHISMYPWERSSFIFRVKKSIFFIFSGNKKYYISTYYKKDHILVRFLGKTIFSEHLKNTSYFDGFFWERWPFLLRLKIKIIFLGKRNITFPDNTRKVIFQCNSFGKRIFSEDL